MLGQDTLWFTDGAAFRVSLTETSDGAPIRVSMAETLDGMGYKLTYADLDVWLRTIKRTVLSITLLPEQYEEPATTKHFGYEFEAIIAPFSCNEAC
jgi:hypothetical protein